MVKDLSTKGWSIENDKKPIEDNKEKVDNKSK